MESHQKKQQVVGFMFGKDFTHVVLIIKEKPAWQKGKHNGVGGKIEDFDESPAHAMAREFREETGLDTRASEWLRYGRMEGPDWAVDLFATRWLDGIEPPVTTKTKERVIVAQLKHLPLIDDLLVNDVMWMLHAARFALYPGGPKWVEVKYEDIPSDSFEAVALGNGIKFPSGAWDRARQIWDMAGDRAVLVGGVSAPQGP